LLLVEIRPQAEILGIQPSTGIGDTSCSSERLITLNRDIEEEVSMDELEIFDESGVAVSTSFFLLLTSFFISLTLRLSQAF
jgi:hypothetical protein